MALPTQRQAIIEEYARRVGTMPSVRGQVRWHVPEGFELWTRARQLPLAVVYPGTEFEDRSETDQFYRCELIVITEIGFEFGDGTDTLEHRVEAMLGEFRAMFAIAAASDDLLGGRCADLLPRENDYARIPDPRRLARLVTVATIVYRRPLFGDPYWRG